MDDSGKGGKTDIYRGALRQDSPTGGKSIFLVYRIWSFSLSVDSLRGVQNPRATRQSTAVHPTNRKNGASRGPRLHTCLMHEDFPVAYKDTQLISAAWPPASSEAWLTWPSVSDERQLSVSAQVWLVRVAFPLLSSQQPSPSFEQLFPRSSAGHL